MQSIVQGNLKLGILGGGQLGKMLIEAASNWNIQCFVLDPDPDCPCAHMAFHFTCGDFKDYATVYAFGQLVDNLTIEIEHVNADALLQLQKEGKAIYPNPSALKIIQDKSKQKLFYDNHLLPTSAFRIVNSLQELHILIDEKKINFPFVYKSATAGYDGKGVQIIKSREQLNSIADSVCVIEELISIKKELAVIAAKNLQGDIVCFPAVEMEFNGEQNLVEFLIAPAHISDALQTDAKQLAIATLKAFDMVGILAVEMFLTTTGELLINEVAPRPHNSGHHTIEANYTSQYEQLLRCIFDMPLGDTSQRSAAVMVNILGEKNYEGNALYEGFKECLAMQGVYIHLYGKKTTKPFRKMGHATIIDTDFMVAKHKADIVKNILKVKS